MELVTVACRCTLRLCSIEVHLRAAKAGAMLCASGQWEQSLLRAQEDAPAGSKVPAPGMADPCSMQPWEPRQPPDPRPSWALPRCRPAPLCPYRTLGVVSLGPNLGETGNLGRSITKHQAWSDMFVLLLHFS